MSAVSAFLLGFLVLILPCPATATAIHVPLDAPTIQAGIDSAAVGDTVLVACGTYHEHDITMKSGVCLRSETGEADCVTIDAQELGRGLYCENLNTTTKVEGFTITNGSASGAIPDDRGAGVYCTSSSPRISNCVFRSNAADGGGGGMICWAQSAPVLNRCVFESNSAGDGGGLFCDNSSPELTDCAFTGNHATGYGGAILGRDSSSLALTQCVISGNSAIANYGGGIHVFSSSSVDLDHCGIFWNFGFRGGAISSRDGTISATSCTFSNNAATTGSGAVLYLPDNASAELAHSILAFSSEGDAVYCGGPSSSATLSCCDVYGNAGGDWVGSIEDQLGVDGNFSGEPWFCNPDDGDYHLRPVSTCLDAPSCGLVGAYGLGSCTRTWYILPNGSGDAPTIQAGIDSASAGDTVLVACGTYYEYDIAMESGICLRSETGEADCVVIDAQQLGRVLDCADVDNTAVIEGLTITAGLRIKGGGIHLGNSFPNIRDCIFHNNSALDDGGAAWVESSSSPTFSRCTFHHNSAPDHAGAVLCQGASPILIRCLFHDNSAGTYGGAVSIWGNCSPVFENCTIAINSAIHGGGVSSYNYSFPVLRNTIVAFSTAGEGVYCGGGSEAALMCCDVFDNAGGDWVGCIASQLGVAGNFSANPLFVNVIARDFNLQSGSPCEDALGCGLVGALGADTTSHEPRVWHVLADGTGDVPTIQAGIDASYTGLDTVLVGPGTYLGVGNRDISFRGKSVVVLSEAGPESTIIVCEGHSEDNHRGFLFEGGEPPSAILDGFTIAAGYARRGAAIYCRGSSPTIRNCVFSSNTAWETGGGVSCFTNASPSLSLCVFETNTAASDGGGLHCESNSSPVLTSCTFSGNSAPSGGGLCCSGGSSPNLSCCILAFSQGGAGVFCDESQPTLACCDLYGNAGGDDLCGLDGGGNIFLNPLFCDQGAEDFRLCPASPCLPENNGCGLLIGARGAGDCPCPEFHVLRVPSQYATIGGALDATSFGDTVLVSPGTYTENIALPWGVILNGVAGPDWTVIDGQGNGATVSIGARKGTVDKSSLTVLDGFTITGGTGAGIHVQSSNPTISNCIVTGNSRFDGGGILCADAAPIIANCFITDNFANNHGGGVYCQRSSATITGCHFSNNIASRGAGVACTGPLLAPELTDVTFSGNSATYYGGGLYCSDECAPVLTRVAFEQNSAQRHGGGLYCRWNSSPVLDECYFFDNAAGGEQIPYGGGVACLDGSSPVLTGCTLVRNSASYGGGVYAQDTCSPTLTNCTVVGNFAWYGGGVCACENAVVMLDGCIVAFSESGVGVWCDLDASSTLSCCDVYGNAFGDWAGCIADQYGINGNIHDDPLFCDPENDDFTLAANSPCAAENSPGSCGLIGAHEVGCGFTAVEEELAIVPTQLELVSVVPNPFNPVTEIMYALPAGADASSVNLGIYDALGRLVRTLVNEDQPAGYYSAVWDGTDGNGASAASGVYFCRLERNGESRTRKMVLLK